MKTGLSVIRASSPEEWRDARRLIDAYAASLDVDLRFQDFDRELEALSSMYGPPRGVMLLARDEEGAAVACAGLRPFDVTTAEIKRLYVIPEARGRNIARTLTQDIITRAAELGYRRLVLDTLPSMIAAQALYRALGFQPIPAYRHNPVPGAVFMERVLTR